MKVRSFLVCMTLGAVLISNEVEPNLGRSDQSIIFHSQASQDEFVYDLLYGLLDKQDKGYYLEIGAGEPIDINNTYYFEKNLGWSGTSIDISKDLESNWYVVRSNLLITADAITSDYRKILRSFPKVIDYLSLDVDGYYPDVLERIPFSNYTFKIITIEHDFYRYEDLYRSKERQILSSLGYHLLCSNVSHQGFAFEDWWIHPSAFSFSVLSTLKSLDLDEKDHKQIIGMIRNAIGQNSN